MLLASPTADAAFGGKVKNIRVKLRKPNQGYRVAVVVQDDDSASGATGLSVAMDFEPVGDGPELESVTVDTPTTMKTTFEVEDVTLANLDDDGTAPVGITLSLDNGEQHAISVHLPGDEESNASREVTFNEFDKVAVSYRTDREGQGRIQVRAIQTPGEAGVRVVGAAVELAGDYWTDAAGESVGTVDAALVGSQVRLVANVDAASETAIGHSYKVTTTLSGADGQVLDTRSEQIDIGGEGLDDGILQSKIRARKKSGYRVVTVTGSDEELPVRGLSTDITTADGEHILTSFDEAPVNVARDFAVSGLTFEDAPFGATYNASLTVRDKEGGTIQVMDIIIENLENEDEVLDSMSVTPAVDSGFDAATVSLLQVSEMTWDVGFGISGELASTVDSVVFQFNEPFEGPVPSENRLVLEFNAEYHKWVETFEPGSGISDEALTIEQFVFTDEGMVVEEVLWTGAVGDTYKNSKGTRTTVGVTSDTADLL
jgi:hypothetical protein